MPELTAEERMNQELKSSLRNVELMGQMFDMVKKATQPQVEKARTLESIGLALAEAIIDQAQEVGLASEECLAEIKEGLSSAGGRYFLRSWEILGIAHEFMNVKNESE